MSDTCYVVLWICLYSSCVPRTASFFGLSFFDCLFGILQRLFRPILEDGYVVWGNWTKQASDLPESVSIEVGQIITVIRCNPSRPKLLNRRGREDMVVGCTTTYVISAFNHWCCRFDSCSGRRVQHYVIKFVSNLWQAVGFLRILWFLPPIIVALNIIKLINQPTKNCTVNLELESPENRRNKHKLALFFYIQYY